MGVRVRVRVRVRVLSVGGSVRRASACERSECGCGCRTCPYVLYNVLRN